MSAGSLVRKGAKAAALSLGLFGRRRPGDVAILLYHRVGAGRREIDLAVPAFEDQMASLREGGAVRSLEEALADGQGGVVVTFDDGYRDFHEHVLPLLVRYRVPAVVYLATGLVADWAGPGARPDALAWSQLEEAVATGLVTVGAHTHSHADLGRATEPQAEEEMRRAKELIENRLGTSCRHFAYPWSVGSAAAQRVARGLFHTAALGWRTNRRGRIDPHRLGRLPVLRSDGPVFFRAKVAGVLDREALAYRLGRRGPWRRS